MQKLTWIITLTVSVALLSGCGGKNAQIQKKVEDQLRLQLARQDNNSINLKGVTATVAAVADLDFTGTAEVQFDTTVPLVKSIQPNFDPISEIRTDWGNAPVNQLRLSSVVSKVVNDLGQAQVLVSPAGCHFTKSFKYDGRLSGDSVELSNLTLMGVNWGNNTDVANGATLENPNDRIYDSTEAYSQALKAKLAEAVVQLKQTVDAEDAALLNRIQPVLNIIHKSSHFTGKLPQAGSKEWQVEAELHWNSDTKQVNGWIFFPELKTKKAWEGSIVFDDQGQPVLQMKETAFIQQAPGSDALLGIIYQLHPIQGMFQGPWALGGYNGSVSLSPLDAEAEQEIQRQKDAYRSNLLAAIKPGSVYQGTLTVTNGTYLLKPGEMQPISLSVTSQDGILIKMDVVNPGVPDQKQSFSGTVSLDSNSDPDFYPVTIAPNKTQQLNQTWSFYSETGNLNLRPTPTGIEGTAAMGDYKYSLKLQKAN